MRLITALLLTIALQAATLVHSFAVPPPPRVLRLPLLYAATDDYVAADDSDDNQQKFQARSKRWVVLVDDEESIRQAVGQYLFDEGYQVTACPDAKTALKVLSDENTLPDLIVSDIRMPEMDGLEFLQEIRSNERLVTIPVVLLTAKSMTQDRIQGYKAGADAYIPKPFDPEELLSIIDNSILRYDTLNEENVKIEDLAGELEEIKHLLLDCGGSGRVGNNGWVADTKVFLAPDERQALELLCRGLYNREIAEEMNLGQSRVEAIVSSMLRKTRVSNRTQLVRWAVTTGNVQV